jgi:lipoic acid synthetase
MENGSISMENNKHIAGKNLRKPPWLLKGIEHTEEKNQVNRILKKLDLSTVCKSARCPNLSDCFHHKRATFLILGDRCTRRCTFCSVEKATPEGLMSPDKNEPERIFRAVKALNLEYVVITSVTRDDLSDGGARAFALTIYKLRELGSGVQIEVLTPDFQGNELSIADVAEAGPDVYNHNIETVPRLYEKIRPGADYKRSLDLLAFVNKNYSEIFLKSGFMLGMGETKVEVLKVLSDLKDSGCSAVTIGQYLRPGHWNVPVQEYIPPGTFKYYEKEAKKIGFLYVASGPYVRSSYMAHEVYRDMVKKK